MSCLGVHLALTEDEASALKLIDDEQVRWSYLLSVLEPRYLSNPPVYAAESDKSWDGMHRALADGRLTYDGGTFPLNHVVLGGEILCNGDDYIMSLKTPQQVSAIAAALALLQESSFRARYDQIDAGDYDGVLGEEDFQYTWNWLQEVRRLYATAAAEGRYVLFSADQ